MFLDYIKTKFRIVVVDTEFQFDAAMSYVKTPICMVLKDLTTGHEYKFWDHQSKELTILPFDYEKTLFVCHYAIAEVSYFLSRLLGRPPFIFDTWTEYSKLYKNRRPSLSYLQLRQRMVVKIPLPQKKKKDSGICVSTKIAGPMKNKIRF